MKFFSQNNKKNPILKKIEIKKPNVTTPIIINIGGILDNFNNFLFKNGMATKNRLCMYYIFSRLNNFIYFNKIFIKENYGNMSWLFDNIYEKDLNSQDILTPLMDLIKPPFTIKSLLISKKIKKKTKIKYAVKIVYKNENKRLRNSFKQMYFYSNKFQDNKFKVRLYKALLFSLLEWKNSYLFKFKVMVFKKFLKF